MAAAPESYIGSVISLTSKSEIRYEGVLYTINTEESSIGLRNVRSFGTEGRKKDGQQIPASDKIYEYILFRGSDIKDLQVKSSPPAQSATLHNDPAIIQSHYPRPASLSTSLPSSASTTAADPTASHNALSGIQMPPPFQGNLPPYQPGANLPSWNSSPMLSSANGTGLTMPPMYWPGYYTPPSGFPHLQPPPFLRPPHGLTVPQALQPPVQYPGLNGPLPAGFPNMQELPSFLQPGSNNNNLSQSSGLSAPISVPASSSTPSIESLGNQVPNKLSLSSSVIVSVGLTTPSSVEPTMSLPEGTPAHVNTKPVAVPDSSLPSLPSEKPVSLPASMPTFLPPFQPPSASDEPATVTEPVTFITSGNLIHDSILSGNLLCSSIHSGNLLYGFILSSNCLYGSVLSGNLHYCSILPGYYICAFTLRECFISCPEKTARTESTTIQVMFNTIIEAEEGVEDGEEEWEDFDFMAMNEKFNKDEVWGHLGKSSGQFDDDQNDYDDNVQEDDEISPRKPEAKTVYVKDDFFDSLSCNTIDNGGRNGRIKFSEQRKIDTEFGCRPLVILQDISQWACGEGGVHVVVVLVAVAIMGEGMDIEVEGVATPTQITSHDGTDGSAPRRWNEDEEVAYFISA
ncbi:hypothetical protein PR202_ga16993 [Eleusine coracana subsp. coracana]|uniref:Lsm14-like N-terminal domain-containing protein n=1 Tax=Eleusine coracana subsp. coracana TaxID=191504 RepID=A0AAV5CP99_ELECO|nr:hypothetical protein PR202_ga16993 [Eleusine coracana subsp. coracana]